MTMINTKQCLGGLDETDVGVRISEKPTGLKITTSKQSNVQNLL
jgi:hypothetical protein